MIGKGEIHAAEKGYIVRCFNESCMTSLFNVDVSSEEEFITFIESKGWQIRFKDSWVCPICIEEQVSPFILNPVFVDKYPISCRTCNDSLIADDDSHGPETDGERYCKHLDVIVTGWNNRRSPHCPLKCLTKSTDDMISKLIDVTDNPIKSIHEIEAVKAELVQMRSQLEPILTNVQTMMSVLESKVKRQKLATTDTNE